VNASCADKLDGFFAEVAYKGKFGYNHTVDILSPESLLWVISLNILVPLIQIFRIVDPKAPVTHHFLSPFIFVICRFEG